MKNLFDPPKYVKLAESDKALTSRTFDTRFKCEAARQGWTDTELANLYRAVPRVCGSLRPLLQAHCIFIPDTELSRDEDNYVAFSDCVLTSKDGAAWLSFSVDCEIGFYTESDNDVHNFELDSKQLAMLMTAMMCLFSKDLIDEMWAKQLELRKSNARVELENFSLKGW